MSDCETIAARMGYAIDSDPTTETVPDLCCDRCHKHGPTGEYRMSGVTIMVSGAEYTVCCEVLRAHNAAPVGG